MKRKKNDNKYDSKYKTELEIPEGFEIYSSMEVIGHKNTTYKKFLMTNLTKSRNAFSALGSSFKSIVGGNIKGLTYLTNNTRNEVIDKLINLAIAEGANAIIGLRCEVTELLPGILDFVVYGTAVYFER